MSEAFPFGTVHLDTCWPVLALMLFTCGLLSIASDTTLPPGTFWLSGGSAVEWLAAQMDSLTASQLDSRSWLPVVGGSFVFIFGSNWAGALLPLELIRVPEAELHAPTADVNVTAGLALAAHSCFYAGFQTRSLVADFSKPLSLSFRRLGNILADELTIAVLSSLVAFIVPVAVMCLGIFTSAIQALVFATLAGAYICESTEVHAGAHFLKAFTRQIADRSDSSETQATPGSNADLPSPRAKSAEGPQNGIPLENSRVKRAFQAGRPSSSIYSRN